MKATKTATLIDRTFIAATNTVLYTFQSSRSEYQYYITANNGVIDTATHQDCTGYKQHGHCYHMDVVIETETPLLQLHTVADTASASFSDRCQYCGKNHNSSDCYL